MPVVHVMEYDEVTPEFSNEQYEPYDHMNGKIPTNTQSISNRREAAVVSLEGTHELLCVKVNSGETPLFLGIIKFNEPLKKLSARLPNQALQRIHH